MKRRRAVCRGALVLAFAMLGCEGNGGDSPGGDGSGGLDVDGGDGEGDGALPDGDGSDAVIDPEPDFDWPASQLSLELATWGLSFSGSIFGGPRVSFHEESARDGACRLLTYEALPCVPECTAGQMCAGGQCSAQPELVSAGALTLGGFTGGPIAIDEVQPGQYFFQTEATTAADAPGDLSVSAAGADVPAFEVHVATVEPPEPSGDWSAILAARGDGGDATLQWTNADPAARVYLRMTTGIGTHGGISPVEVECEGPDTGSLRLPGAYLDALYAQGWSCGECGGNDVWRYRAAVVEGTIPIQVRVQARFTFFHHPNF